MGIFVRSDHYLFFGLMEAIEGVEKLILTGVFSSQKLNIIDQQQIAGIAIAISKGIKLPFPDRLDVGIYPLRRRQIDDLQSGIFGLGPKTDGMQQVSLAQTHPTK